MTEHNCVLFLPPDMELKERLTFINEYKEYVLKNHLNYITYFRSYTAKDTPLKFRHPQRAFYGWICLVWSGEKKR